MELVTEKKDLADKSNRNVSNVRKAKAWEDIYFDFCTRFGEKYKTKIAIILGAVEKMSTFYKE